MESRSGRKKKAPHRFLALRGKCLNPPENGLCVEADHNPSLSGSQFFHKSIDVNTLPFFPDHLTEFLKCLQRRSALDVDNRGRFEIYDKPRLSFPRRFTCHCNRAVQTPRKASRHLLGHFDLQKSRPVWQSDIDFWLCPAYPDTFSKNGRSAFNIRRCGIWNRPFIWKWLQSQSPEICPLQNALPNFRFLPARKFRIANDALCREWLRNFAC